MEINKILTEYFQNPSQVTKPFPLWFWNAPLKEMTEEKIREVVRQSFEQSEYNGFAILSNWLEGYLSEEYINFYRVALEEGKKYGMQFSLYDENGFPSYNAGGLFERYAPDLTAKRLDKYEKDAQLGDCVSLQLPSGKFMGAVAWNIDTNERIDISDAISCSIDETCALEYSVTKPGNWKVMAFICVKDGNNGMDYLDKKAVRAYLDVVYEKYYEEFEEYFGSTITSAFYDEPTFLNWPWSAGTNYGVEGSRTWTPEFNEEYEKIYHENPVRNYPALWYDIGVDTVEARDKMHYVRTNLFATNYIGQIAEWCENHGIALSGHMLLEEYVNPVGLHGDLMKVFQYQQIPGVDVICSHGNAQEAYKIVSSVAYNWDKRLVMSEAFGAIQDANPDTLLKITMDLYAKGINQVIPHAVWYDEKHVNFLPELSYRDSMFAPFLPILNRYIGRLNMLLQGGRHVADLAMLYPIDYLEASYSFDMGIADQTNPSSPFYAMQQGPEDADYMRVGELLSLQLRKDFTYLHPEIIEEKCSVEGNVFHLKNEINYEDYQVLIIPGTKVISLSNLKKIYYFYKNGGKVISTTQLPYQATRADENEQVIDLILEMFNVHPMAEQDMKKADKSYTKHTNANGGAAYFVETGLETNLAHVLEDAVDKYDVDIQKVPALSNGNLSYIHKVKDQMDIYFIANSSETIIEGMAVILRGEMKEVEIWDPMTGQTGEVDFVAQKGVTTIELCLDKVKSIFLVGRRSEL